MPRNTNDDGDQIDIGMCHHLSHVMKREVGSKLLRRSLRSVFVSGANGLQFVVGQCVQSGNMRVRTPTAAALRYRRADDADPDLISHNNCLRLFLMRQITRPV